MSRSTAIALTCFISGLLASNSRGHAQTIALPSFHVFSYSGTVEVPDGGSVSLGGYRSSQWSSSTRGFGPWRLLSNRAIGGQAIAGGATITATIIDHQEIDRQLLGDTPQGFIERERRRDAPQLRPATASTAHAANARRSGESDPNEEGKSLVRYARSLYQRGQRHAAADTYRLAIARLDRHLAQLAAAEMKRAGLE